MRFVIFKLLYTTKLTGRQRAALLQAGRPEPLSAISLPRLSISNGPLFVLVSYCINLNILIHGDVLYAGCHGHMGLEVPSGGSDGSLVNWAHY